MDIIRCGKPWPESEETSAIQNLLAPMAQKAKGILLAAALKTAKFAPKLAMGAAALGTVAAPAALLTACPHEPEVDLNHIGKHGGIEVRVADGVDRSHGQEALDNLKTVDETDIISNNNGLVKVLEITGQNTGTSEIESFNNGTLRGHGPATTLIGDAIILYTMAENIIYIAGSANAKNIQSM